jgi:hypothetical protein
MNPKGLLIAAAAAMLLIAAPRPAAHAMIAIDPVIDQNSTNVVKVRKRGGGGGRVSRGGGGGRVSGLRSGGGRGYRGGRSGVGRSFDGGRSVASRGYDGGRSVRGGNGKRDVGSLGVRNRDFKPKVSGRDGSRTAARSFDGRESFGHRKVFSDRKFGDDRKKLFAERKFDDDRRFFRKRRHHRALFFVGPSRDYGYDDYGCQWLKWKAIHTGSPYWWRRYDRCRSGWEW